MEIPSKSMRFYSVFWILPTLSLVSGCALFQSSGGSPVANGPPGPTPAVETSAPIGAPPPAVSGIDIRVASLVRHTLKTDETLAPVSGNVKVKVNKGVVSLRGKVPTAHDRDEIVDRISKIPGVDGVDDQLEVGVQ